MKTYAEILAARRTIVDALKRPDLHPDAQVILGGMCTALQWVCDEEQPPQTMKRFLSGDELRTTQPRKATP